MKISNTMDLNQLTEHMGHCATVAEARVMRDELCARNLSGMDTGDVSERVWLFLCDRALLAVEREVQP